MTIQAQSDGKYFSDFLILSTFYSEMVSVIHKDDYDYGLLIKQLCHFAYN